MKLSDAKVKNSKPRNKPYKLTDGKGMYLLVTTKGSKLWRLDYSFNKKRNTHTLGTYPVVSLNDARTKRTKVKQLIEHGIDPNIHKKTIKIFGEENRFETIAREWHTSFSASWSEDHSNRILKRLEKDIFPWLGSSRADKISAPQLLAVMKKAEKRGALETAHRIRQNCGAIFRYAISTGRAGAEADVSIPLKGALPAVKPKHHASITDPKELSELLNVMDGYHGEITTRFALKLAPLLFSRPGELRKAEWSEFNFFIVYYFF